MTTLAGGTEPGTSMRALISRRRDNGAIAHQRGYDDASAGSCEGVSGLVMLGGS